jgi:hypothetical protein
VLVWRGSLSGGGRVPVRVELPLLACRAATGSAFKPFAGIVDAPGIRPTKDIFVGSKAPWFEISDDLPQFEEHATA